MDRLSRQRSRQNNVSACDEVKKTIPRYRAHVYYGLDNLYKFGIQGLADKLKAMMDERPLREISRAHRTE